MSLENFLDLFLSNNRYVIMMFYSTIMLGLLIWSCNQIKKLFQEVIRFYKWIFVFLPQKRRDRKFLQKIREIGCIIAYNEEAGIIAVTSRRLLIKEVAQETKRLTDRFRESEDDLARVLSRPIRVMPVETFTFAKEEEGFSYPTASSQFLEEIFDSLIWERTKFSSKDVSENAWNRGRSILVTKDKRLLVPMLRGGNLPNGELMLSLASQVSVFGSYTKDDAKTTIMSYN